MLLLLRTIYNGGDDAAARKLAAYLTAGFLVFVYSNTPVLEFTPIVQITVTTLISYGLKSDNQ